MDGADLDHVAGRPWRVGVEGPGRRDPRPVERVVPIARDIRPEVEWRDDGLDADALAALESLLRDPSPDVRIAVLEALDRLGAVGSLPVLRDVALYDAAPEAREMAYHVISSLTERRVRYLDARSIRSR